MSIFEAEHFSKAQCDRILASYADRDRDARAKGIPQFCGGRIFSFKEEDFVVDPFELPGHFFQIGCIDFGWNHPTAALKLAWDADSDVVYAICEYAKSSTSISEHARVLKDWGEDLAWAWPHDGSKHECGSGETIANLYKKEGMKMLRKHAHYKSGGYSLERSVSDIINRIRSNRLKVFSGLGQLIEEMSFYHRDEGKIVKEKDDLISALRYGLMMLRYAPKGARGFWSYAVID